MITLSMLFLILALVFGLLAAFNAPTLVRGPAWFPLAFVFLCLFFFMVRTA